MSENTTPEQPESPALRSLADFLGGRGIATRGGYVNTRTHERVSLTLAWAEIQGGLGPDLTEAETSTVLALFALVALEWVAR